jgi:hypothetical protein
MRGISVPSSHCGDPSAASRRHEVACGCGAAPSVCFEDGSQPSDLLDEGLHRLEFLAPELVLLHLVHTTGFPSRTPPLWDHPTDQKDREQSRQAKPPRLRDQAAPHPAFRLKPRMPSTPSSAPRRGLTPRCEGLPHAPAFLRTRLERLQLLPAERA